MSTLHRFDADKQVRIPRKAFEGAVPAVFRSDDILEAAGIKVNKTHYVGPLSAWRFLRDDEDALAFAKELEIDPRTKSCTVRNTDALRASTLPWVGQGKATGKSGFASVYSAEGKIADPITLRMVRPAKKA